jgi:hypothetical protein
MNYGDSNYRGGRGGRGGNYGSDKNKKGTFGFVYDKIDIPLSGPINYSYVVIGNKQDVKRAI